MRLAGFLRFTIIYLSFAVVLILPQLVNAKEVTSAEKAFVEMKDSCHKKYEKFMAGSSDNMIGGSYAYNECLQGQMGKVTKGLFAPEREKDFFKDLSDAAKNYYSLTNKIYFNNKKCDAHCGTMYIPLKIQAVSPLYENTLWQLLFVSSEHGMNMPSAEPPEIERDKELVIQ